MTDLTIFTQLHSALVTAVETMRIQAGEVRVVPPVAITGYEATAARRALSELVPYERNLRKMMDGLRTNQLTRYRDAGQQLVAHLVKEYVRQANTADSMSPAWSLPLTPELIGLVLPGADIPVPDSVVQKLNLTPEQVEILRVLKGTTVREMADDFRAKVILAHKKRLARRQAALERAKQVLSEEDLMLLLDKTLY